MVYVLFLQHSPFLGWHHSSCFGSVLAFEVICHLLKCDPFYSFMLVNMIDDPMRWS